MSEERTEQQIDLERAVMGPLVEVVTRERRYDPFPFSDLQLEGDDPATISDDDVKTRCERWLDLEPGTLGDYKVNRPATGHLLVSPAPVYG